MFFVLIGNTILPSYHSFILLFFCPAILRSFHSFILLYFCPAVLRSFYTSILQSSFYYYYYYYYYYWALQHRGWELYRKETRRLCADGLEVIKTNSQGVMMVTS